VTRRHFDRPIFVIAMPRSGSTLLFDLLSAHDRVFSWGDEAYPPWAAVDPAVGSGEEGDSFRVPIDDEAARRAGAVLHGGVVAASPLMPWLLRRRIRRYRLVEKTPANVIRVAALAHMWPDARFIHLTRDAPANISSLLEGRERGLAVRDWPSRNGMEWHFLMPPGWQEHLADSPVEQFAWQWEAGNEAALNDLSGRDHARVRYEDLIANPQDVVADLLTFAALRPSSGIARAVEAMAPSKHTLSAPRDDKWREREAEIAPVLPGLAGLRRALGYEI
jgi:hypothetical protein